MLEKICKVKYVIGTKLRSVLFGYKVGFPSYVKTPFWFVVRGKLEMGSRVRIQHLSRLEVGPDAILKICNNVSMGPNLNITCFNRIYIGNDVTISANVFITDMDHDISSPDKSVMDCNNIISDGTIIEDNCFIGTGSVILAGSYLGKGCVVGANSTVRGSYPPNSVIVGSPGKFLRKR